jgi:hypothetical protein
VKNAPQRRFKPPSHALRGRHVRYPELGGTLSILLALVRSACQYST